MDYGDIYYTLCLKDNLALLKQPIIVVTCIFFETTVSGSSSMGYGNTDSGHFVLNNPILLKC
jgi:hypothetical protein